MKLKTYMERAQLRADCWIMTHVSKHPGLWGGVTAASIMAVVLALVWAI